MKQATQDTDFILVETAEPVEFSDLLQRNHTVSKTGIEYKALAFVNRVLENGGPLAIAENLAAIKHFVKAIENDCRLEDYVLEELGKTKGKTELPTGTKIEKTEAGTKYIFTNCNDTELLRLEWQLEKAQRELKERQAFLKTVPAKGIEVVNSETGEMERIYPPIKSSISTYRVTLAKGEAVTTDLGDDLPF